MLKAICNKDSNAVNIQCSGTPLDILTDTAAVVGAAYSAIYKADQLAAESFRALLTSAMLDPDSPIWVPRASETHTNITICIPRKRKDGTDA